MGEALNELTELPEEGDWGIDQAVYAAATHIATELVSYGLPAPKIFNHGSRSVVFNWTMESVNVYLTISADWISALISTPDRIQKRLEYPSARIGNPTAAFLGIGLRGLAGRRWLTASESLLEFHISSS